MEFNSQGKNHEYEFDYLNLQSIYILSSLAASQSMGKIGYAFKNVKNVESIKTKTFPILDGGNAEMEGASDVPYITRHTMAYAISLTVSCLCYAINDESNKGRADEVYDKALRDLEQMTDVAFTELLAGLLQYYVQSVVSPEPPGPGPLEMSRQQVAERARGGAAAAPASGGGGGAIAAGGGGEGRGVRDCGGATGVILLGEGDAPGPGVGDGGGSDDNDDADGNDKDNDSGNDKDSQAKDSRKDKVKDTDTAADEDAELQSTTPTQASPSKKSPPTKPPAPTGKAAGRGSGGTGTGNGRGRGGGRR